MNNKRRKYSASENFSKFIDHPGLSLEDKQHVWDELDRAIDHFTSERAKHRHTKFTRHTHKQIDAVIKKEMAPEHKQNMACKKGCSFCCMLNVDITIDEAKLLLVKAPEKINWDKIETQSKHSLDTWREMKVEDRVCTFLENNSCSVYEFRPMACRNHSVVSDPYNCDTINNFGALTANINVWQAELITSALFSIMETGNMATMLLKAKSLLWDTTSTPTQKETF